MKVLLMKYIDRDDSLLSSSQLSVGEVGKRALTLSLNLPPHLSDGCPPPP